jgi:hypothetical protein
MLTVVTGPPCSGKTTWVRFHAQTDEIVIDLDELAYALTVGRTNHDYTACVRGVAINARAAAIRAALPLSLTHNVYVIHTTPSRLDWQAYKQHQARIVRLNPGYDVCIARAAEERPAWVAETIRAWYFG